jgi:hypothetical protein
MTKIKILYWKFFNPPLYGAYLELKRVMDEINECKRKHKKYKHLLSLLHSYRAAFEMLKNKSL